MLIKRILLLAGEASGDLLGAALTQELLRLQPSLQLMGMGGDKMRQAGVEILIDNRSLNIVGWWEVVKNFSIIRQAMKTIKHILQTHRPDLLILIDYPGFNLRMAKAAKRAGIKVLYYVSPQIWAWHYQRIKIIQRYVDHMAVLFAFEAEIYRKEKVSVTFVGHPLSELVQADQPKSQIYQQYQLDPQRPVIAIFPGSRVQEIQRLLPLMVSATQLIRHQIPNAQFVLPLASSLSNKYLPADLINNITVVTHNTYNLLSICDAAIVKSGTSTLEVALSQVPLVIVYKTNLINYWIARSVARVKQIGLCNIVAEEPIAKEFIQAQATPQMIAEEIIRLMTDIEYRQKILSHLTRLREKMPKQNNSQKVAQLVISLL